jgi:CHAT domain-containing protein
VLTITGFPVPLRRAADRAFLSVQEARARRATGDPAVFATRLSSDGGGPAGLTASVLPSAHDKSDRLDLAASLLHVAQRVGGDAGAAGAGVAYFLAEEPVRSAAAFASERATGKAAAQNDIAAAEAASAREGNNTDRLLIALEAADHAIELGFGLEARFNRAMIVEELGVIPAARSEWQRYLANESSPAWSSVARRHLASLPATDVEAWKISIRKEATFSDASWTELTRRLPQQARTYGEGPFLSSWAEAMSRADEKEARLQLDRARLIGEALRRQSGETLLSDSVAAIDGAPADRDLINGHLAYGRGRIFYARSDRTNAERELRSAAESFARGRSPMAQLARFYVASILYDQDRIIEATEMLDSLLRSEERAGDHHKALLARLRYQRSLCDAVSGHWSDSLDAASHAVATYHALGERGTEADAQAVLSEDYDFLGQPELARRRGIVALRFACGAGDLRRARTILAALSRTELRSGRWSCARSIINLENALAKSVPEAPLDADMQLRLAAAESRLGRASATSRAIVNARSAASRINDPAECSRLRADIDGVDGTIARHHDPRRAVALLSSAIAFQQAVARPIVLPELHLARGRSYLALERLDDAQRDFDAGITEIEKERGRTRDSDLRPAFFDNATDLFQESVSLQIRRGIEPARILATVERGRARTVLELIEGRDASPIPAIEEVQRHISPESVLVEYESLPDMLAIFVVDAHHIVVRASPVSRNQLRAAATAFLTAFNSEPHDRPMRFPPSELFDYLIMPIERDLAGYRNINVIADDILQRVPFAALSDPKSRSFLIERYSISMAPSAGVFVSATNRASVPAKAPPTVLVFANPTAPSDRFPTLPPLEGAEREADAITAIFPASKVFTGDDATAARFLAAAPSYDIIHFGGHAIVSPDEPARSALICASSSNRDGVVTSKEIARMRFRSTRLIVLAACSTVSGRNAAVEGVSSLATAFLVAGVPAVIGTFWDIDDQAAAPLVKEIYRAIANGASPAEAVRSAQIKAIHTVDPDGRAARHWAAFVIMGVRDIQGSDAPRREAGLQAGSDSARPRG